ncbi:hypothetical protein B0A55_12048 [Friedmanniomyces simplex]|uniref:Uncharacterized protein n=1 Tax=Friedmanniomyces simplex TaxID=329884 RepID=A0A4U0WBD3_9PEZI|nr:hypothetical protein B0A55_12048 [Friedmanniomyces simplex]
MDRPALPVDLAGFALCSWIPGTVMLLVKIFGRDGAQRGRPVEYGSALATILTIVQAFLLYFATVSGWGLDIDMSHSGEISRAHTLSIISVALLIIAQGCFRVTDVLVVHFVGHNDGTAFSRYVRLLGVLDILWACGSNDLDVKAYRSSEDRGAHKARIDTDVFYEPRPVTQNRDGDGLGP